MAEMANRPEGKPETRKDAVPNKGEIYYAEQHAFDPLASEAAKMMSHRGGLASPRTEHY